MKSVPVALGLAVAAWICGTQSAQWRVQSALNVIWRTLGRDKRLSRVYNHTFADYGTYNFTSRAWPGIDRRSLASLTADEFRERYVEGRTPVILTDISPLREWSLERLRKECGRMEVSFARRYSAGLRAIPEWARRIFLDPRTIKAYNKSTAEIIDAMHAEKTLQEYLSSLESDKEAILTAKDNINLYGGNIVDYLFPVMLSAQHIDKHDCRPLMQEGNRVLSRLMEFAAEAREDRPTYASMHPVLFVAPAGSRAIPLHQHGPFNDNLLWMLHGTKKVVVVSPSSTRSLYERPEFGGSEYADRVFSADVLQPNEGSQPDVRHARALEGYVSAGELIYLPVNVPHAIETTDDNTSVMLAWQMPVPGIARMFFKKSCSYLEELQDYPPWAKKCAALEEIMNREDAR